MNLGAKIKYLIQGDISCISKFTNFATIEAFNKSPKRMEIIKGSFDKLKNVFPEHAFVMVYDLDEYKDYCIEFINNNITRLDSRFILNYVLNTKWALHCFRENFEQLEELDCDSIFVILRYVIETNEESLFRRFVYSNNLNFRGKVMIELLNISPRLFTTWYRNVTNYFTIIDEQGNKQVIDEKYVSEIAYLIIDKGLSKDVYDEVKEFIFQNYEENDLAKLLDGSFEGCYFDEKAPYPDLIAEDFERMYETAKTYKFDLYDKYPHLFKKEILGNLDKQLKKYIGIDKEVIRHLFRVGLGNKFLELSSKYMELCTGAKCVSNVGMGSCTRAFLVGDYVIKCSYRKWVPEICPNMFLIAKNYDEVYAYSDEGKIIGAIEVQRYYSRPYILMDNSKSKKVLKRFYEEFVKLGYVWEDELFGIYNEPNLFYLDSYSDADCEEPEQLPDWFKENPLVLVDRDYVYKKVNK